jgi:hypothetical protein
MQKDWVGTARSCPHSMEHFTCNLSGRPKGRLLNLPDSLQLPFLAPAFSEFHCSSGALVPGQQNCLLSCPHPRWSLSKTMDFLWWYWGVELRASHLQAGALSLSHSANPFGLGYF